MIRTSPFKLSTCRNWKECKAAAIMLGASLSLIPTYSTSELTRKDVAPSRTPFARFVPVRSCSLSFFFIHFLIALGRRMHCVRLGWFTCSPCFARIAKRPKRFCEASTQSPCGLVKCSSWRFSLSGLFDGYVRWLHGMRTLYRYR